MIRVLLVDDSPIALHLQKGLLARAPDIVVAGTAGNGREALELLPRLNPDVVCTDLHMPVMDGLEFTREVMRSFPRPILVVSVSVMRESINAFRMLEAGAVDVYPKPSLEPEANQERQARDFAAKIRILAGVHVFRRPSPAGVRPTLPSSRDEPIGLVAIGASTGGPQALRIITAALPADFAVPVICVQHIGNGFLAPMVAWLAEVSRLPVRLAGHGELPQPGVIHFAPPDLHLELDGRGRFELSDAPPCDGHRPSATVTLRAVARRYGVGAVGVLLTGMGRDGAAGMAAIAAVGGVTIAQDEATSVVYGMPREAVALGAVQQVLPLEQIAPALVALARRRNGGGAATREAEST